MTPIHIEVRQATQWAAQKYLEQQQLTPERKREVQRLTEYNMLAYAFNSSTVMLAVAAVAAAFFSFNTAAVFGAIALFVRSTASHEMEGMAKPLGMAALQHAVNRTDPSAEQRIQNICRNVNIEVPRPDEQWAETFISIFGHAVWKATLPEGSEVRAPQQRDIGDVELRQNLPQVVLGVMQQQQHVDGHD